MGEVFIAGPDTLNIRPDPSIGIEEIRNLQTFLSRKPLQSKQNTVIITEAEKLTLPAQQALLKTLEEPPGNSQIYLVTDHPDQLLPTILSRVQMYHASMHRLIDASSLKKSSELLNSLITAKGVGERLVLIDSAAFTRESALQFLDDLEQILHSDLTSPSLRLREGLGESYSLIVTTRTYLKANVNVKLALDHLVIKLIPLS